MLGLSLSVAALPPPQQQEKALQPSARDGPDPVKTGFEGEGILTHLFAMRDIPTWIEGKAPWFEIHRDCGASCSAWSLARKDLPFTLALMSQWNHMAVGYISSLEKLKDRITALSPIDANSINRNCCQNGEFGDGGDYHPACTAFGSNPGPARRRLF